MHHGDGHPGSKSPRKAKPNVLRHITAQHTKEGSGDHHAFTPQLTDAAAHRIDRTYSREGHRNRHTKRRDQDDGHHIQNITHVLDLPASFVSFVSAVSTHTASLEER
ncbi:hypothetical protein SDC9_199095 [bioreactor metagenome]|uniref:Uncharacterized protein n=1 Tax=bioreactor metagenome TaxID=1076179 RepID=A0A645ILV8_9ZZZZ